MNASNLETDQRSTNWPTRHGLLLLNGGWGIRCSLPEWAPGRRRWWLPEPRLLMSSARLVRSRPPGTDRARGQVRRSMFMRRSLIWDASLAPSKVLTPVTLQVALVIDNSIAVRMFCRKEAAEAGPARCALGPCSFGRPQRYVPSYSSFIWSMDKQLTVFPHAVIMNMVAMCFLLVRMLCIFKVCRPVKFRHERSFIPF